MSELTIFGFARPWLLLVAVTPILLFVLQSQLLRRQQRRWERLGRPAMLRQMVEGPRKTTLWRMIAVSLAWTGASVAVAGPQWGTVESSGVAVGRDLVIVLDVSRSMLAEDMQDREHRSRGQAAVAAAKILIEASRHRGGDRIALVIFAARPLVLAPLTTDADHLLLKLEMLDLQHPPADVRPDSDDAKSGTRIGAALAAAVALHDDRFGGFQDIVLFTDADDPADDGEWRQGVTAARAAGVPVNVVGLGDSERESFLLRDGEPLEGPLPDGTRSPIRTRLHEEVARAIATEGRGLYLPARTTVPDLREFYRTAIPANASREISDERRSQPRDRSTGFYLAAVMLLALAWCWPAGRLD